MKTSNENVVLNKSFEFALQVIKANQYLREAKHEYVLSKQLLRSGTSIGANSEEAQEAESKADFIHKFSIANKECRETIYWIKLLIASGYLIEYEMKDEILQHAIVLKRLITSIIKSSKN